MKIPNKYFIPLVIILSVVLVSAAFYPEPWGSNQDADGNNIINVGTIFANYFSGDTITVSQIIAATSWCYQENATTATSCGGLSTGAYANSTNNWSATYPITNAYDGNWSTYAQMNNTNGTTEYFYINYTKPGLATSGSLWTIKRASAINNYSINSQCWDHTNLNFRAVVINSSTSVESNYWQCYNGTAYLNVTASQSGSKIYEEAMVWKISNGSTLDFPATWTNLQDYPAACPAGAITALNDSVTCTDAWVDVAGDTMTGDLIINSSSLLILKTNVSAMTCNETYAGAIYYNNVTNKHYGCNVSNWNALY